MKSKLIFLSTICLLLISPLSQSQIPNDVINEINSRVKQKLNTSIVIGLFEKGTAHYYAEGWQNKAAEIPATTNSVYEIGSISKTFTGLLLAIMAKKHDFDLDEAIHTHWPQSFKLNDEAGQAISFTHLATHTSGLPRLPNNLNLFSDDPYAAYSRDDLIEAVTAMQPTKAGSHYAYSNFGAGLLGETMAVIAEDSYNNLIQKHILTPLNLNQTYMTLNEVPSAQLAQGYLFGIATPPWNFQALAGAGSIRGSIKDLLSYGAAYLNTKNNNLSAAMNLATQVHYAEDNLKIGLGWHFSKSGLLWHNGATAGFSSMIIIDKSRQKVVAAITNTSNQSNVEDIALHLMDSTIAMRQQN